MLRLVSLLDNSDEIVDAQALGKDYWVEVENPTEGCLYAELETISASNAIEEAKGSIWRSI